MILDALIIGGGPAGSTTALLLAQAGFCVGLVEKKEFPRRKVCGEFISATTLPLLKKLGIDEFYLDASGPDIHRIALYFKETTLIAAMPEVNQSLGKWGRAVGREYLDSTLLNKALAAGIKKWQPAYVKNIHYCSVAKLFTCSVVCRDETKHISTRIIIMASGSWENKDPITGKLPVHKFSDFLAFKAHFRSCDLDPDLMPLITFPGGYGGIVNTDNSRVTLSCCIRRDTLKRVRQYMPNMQAGEAILQYIMAECAGAQKIFMNAKRENAWLAAGPIQPGIRKCYADGVFFVGNLAGEAHPIIAEGISMAMQSAWLLSQVLIKNYKHILLCQNFSEIGATYTQQWKKQFATRIYAATLFAQIVTRPWALALLLPLIRQFPSMLTLAAKLSGKAKLIL